MEKTAMATEAPAPVHAAAFAGLEGVEKKTTKVVPVTVEYIEALEKSYIEELEKGVPVLHPRGIADHLLMCPAESQVEQEFRDCFAEIAEGVKELSDEEAAVLEQYRQYGCAYEEFEVDDEEEA